MIESGGTVQRSSELAAVMKRLLGALERGDEASIRALMTASDDTLIMGSAPHEWYQGTKAADLFVAQSKDMPEFHYDVERLEAFENGAVGWSVADVISVLESGPAILLRMTAVFTLERDVWRMVHWHTSAPHDDDPDIIPAELTETIRRLLESLDVPGDLAALRSRLGTSTVTILFTDLEDSTRRTAEAGDEGWGEFITRHFETIEDIASSNDGVLVKTLGDGAMLAFGSVRAALRAAVAIRESGRDDDAPAIRIGVHAGEAVKTADDYFGQTVNIAARIAAASAPGEILVSEVVMKLAGGGRTDFVFGEPRLFEFKGIEGVQMVHPVEQSETMSR